MATRVRWVIDRKTGRVEVHVAGAVLTPREAEQHGLSPPHGLRALPEGQPCVALNVGEGCVQR